MLHCWNSKLGKKVGWDRRAAPLGVVVLMMLSAGCGSAPAPSSPGKNQASKQVGVANGSKEGSKPDEKSSTGKVTGAGEPDQSMKAMQKQMDLQMMPKDKKK